MRYVSGFLYALAFAGHVGFNIDTLMVGACVFTGTVCFGFAVEGIVRDIVYKAMKGS